MPSGDLTEAIYCELDIEPNFEASLLKEERSLDREVIAEVTALSRDFISACIVSTRDGTFSLAITPSLDREMFSGSVDAGLFLALSFHHGDPEPDLELCRSFDESWGGGGGGGYARDKNTSARVCAENAGGAYVRGGGGIFAGHYGMYVCIVCVCVCMYGTCILVCSMLLRNQT